MFRRDESGYSIVEVMVAILILMAAIIPMFKMFDVSLQTATRSSDYDRARVLAEKQTEIAQSIDFSTLWNSFPVSDDVTCASSTGSSIKTYSNCQDKSKTTDGSFIYSNLRFEVKKSYVKSTESGSQITLVGPTDPASPPDPTDMIKIIIEVRSENDPVVLFRTVGVIANHD